MTTNELVESLKKQTKEEVLQFIRKRLEFNHILLDQIHSYREKLKPKMEHRRFIFSGYEVETGSCTVNNINILNEFADLGIYDYTHYLFIDFYKGSPYIYLRYWYTDDNYVFDNLDASTTSELIYKIFELTIFSNMCKRRRF